MHRIDTPTAQKDKFGKGKNGFTRGNPQTGTLATKMDSLYFDAIQEEIANAIESVGITLNKEKHDQLKLAIQQHIKNGQIKLSSSTNSKSETEAATSLAVKTVNDNAVKKSGDTINGQLIIDSDWSGLKIKNSQGNLWITRVHPDNSYSISSFDTSTNTNQFKLRYVGSLNKWRFENIEDVTISGKSVLKAGDGGVFSKAPLLPSGTNLLSDDVLSVSQTFTLAGNYLNAPVTGITGTLIVTRRMYDAGAGATLEINQTNNRYYKTTAHKTASGWDSDGWIEFYTSAHKKLPNVIDKFTSGGVESRVYSNDKRFYLLVRDDGFVGMYNTVNNCLEWGFNDAGMLREGNVPVERILNLDQFVRDRSTPVGVPMPWPTTTPPAGWLKCNGWRFDKNKYPKLAKAYPSGYLPEIRGETIRGWDDGRGVDPGRQILSWQGDAIRNIQGRFPTVYRATNPPPIGCEGVFRTDSFWNAAVKRGNSDDWGAIFSLDASRVVPTAHENRVRSIAFLYIVKAE